MSGTDFSIHCAKCFAITYMNSPQGGSVVSCGDFLCGTCAQHLISGSSCPACGKQGVRTVFLNDSLPEDVKTKILDPLQLTGQLEALIAFQISYYKQILGKAISKNQVLEQELLKKNAKIKELEEKLRLPAASQPFFMNTGNENKEAVKSAPFLQINSYKESEQQPMPSRYQSPQHVSSVSDSRMLPPHQRTRLRNEHFSSPIVNGNDNLSFSSTTNQEATMPEYAPNNAWNRMANRDSYDHSYPSSRHAGNYEGLPEPNKQRRPFTPARSNFSAASDNRFSRSPKLRSPGEPLLAPSRYNPLMNQVRPRGGVGAENYRPPQQETQRSAMSSPLNAFMMRNKR